MDTVDRVCSRGHAPSQQDPNVVVNFAVPTRDLPPVGQAVGCVFPFEQSRYRILEVSRGNLKSRVTAERFVTADDWDAAWDGYTAEDAAVYWMGYSAGDQMIQPLRSPLSDALLDISVEVEDGIWATTSGGDDLYALVGDYAVGGPGLVEVEDGIWEDA